MSLAIRTDAICTTWRIGPSPSKDEPELIPIPSMIANIEQRLDRTYFRFCCHLVLKIPHPLLHSLVSLKRECRLKDQILISLFNSSEHVPTALPHFAILEYSQGYSLMRVVFLRSKHDRNKWCPFLHVPSLFQKPCSASRPPGKISKYRTVWQIVAEVNPGSFPLLGVIKQNYQP